LKQLVCCAIRLGEMSIVYCSFSARRLWDFGWDIDYAVGNIPVRNILLCCKKERVYLSIKSLLVSPKMISRVPVCAYKLLSYLSATWKQIISILQEPTPWKGFIALLKSCVIWYTCMCSNDTYLLLA
jgi:hypothetical protein